MRGPNKRTVHSHSVAQSSSWESQFIPWIVIQNNVTWIIRKEHKRVAEICTWRGQQFVPWIIIHHNFIWIIRKERKRVAEICTWRGQQSWGSQNLHRNAPRIWKKNQVLGGATNCCPVEVFSISTMEQNWGSQKLHRKAPRIWSGGKNGR